MPIPTPNDTYSGRDQCAACKVSLTPADPRYCTTCRDARDTDTAARDAGLDITKYCSGCKAKLSKDATVYCRADATTNRDRPPNDQKAALDVAAAREGARYGMSTLTAAKLEAVLSTDTVEGYQRRLNAERKG